MYIAYSMIGEMMAHRICYDNMDIATSKKNMVHSIFYDIYIYIYIDIFCGFTSYFLVKSPKTLFITDPITDPGETPRSRRPQLDVGRLSERPWPDVSDSRVCFSM